MKQSPLSKYVLIALVFIAFKAYSQTGPVPENFPELIFKVNDNPSEEGYLFLAPFEEWGSYVNFPPYAIIMDNRGTPIFYENSGTVPFYDFKVQPNGMITYFGGNYEGGFHVMNNKYEVFRHIYAVSSYTDFHELQLLSNGHALLVSWDDRLVDMDTVVPGGHQGVTVRGNIIEEIDLNGNLVWEWNGWDYYKITDAMEYMVDLYDEDFIDYVHMNCIEPDTDTTLILSPRNLDEFTRIDRRTGEIIWRLGGKNNDFTFINDTLQFSMAHHITLLDNGNYLLFDNGISHDPRFSSVIEYALDENEMTATLVNRYRNTPDDVFGYSMGSALRLPDGHTLAGWGSGYPNLTEFHPDGSPALVIAWEGVHYRVYRQPWDPRAFTFDTDSLFFGEVNPGVTHVEPFMITNNLEEPLEINQLIIFDEQFHYDETQLPLVIQPGNSKEFELKFTPADTGVFMDVITFCQDSQSDGMNRRIGRQLKVSGVASEDAGIEEPAKEVVFAGPNPGEGFLRIVSNRAELSTIRITNTEGKTLVNHTINGGYEYMADLRRYPDGIYLILITLKDKEHEFYFKYIKQTMH
jgi:hypothetical protein